MFWAEPASPVAAVQAALSRLTASVVLAQGLIAAGRQIDLTGLDTAAGLVCAQVLDLPPTDGVALRPKLLALNTHLNDLLARLNHRDIG